MDAPIGYVLLLGVAVTEIYIALAIPVFFALIALEYAWSASRGTGSYRLNDAIANLGCGIGQQMTNLWWKAALFAAYVGTYELFAVAEWSTAAVGTWVFGVLAVDHQYYWWHRVSHRTKLVWTTHVVHHQSEDYNLAVALRQAWFSSVGSTLFYLPLAVLGLPPLVFAICGVTNTLYQFWIHTEAIDRLGPLEWVLNTPSHHRVHHAVDPRYVDKNYAGFLIVWDRLYGTFVREDGRPTYGTVTPLKSFSPLWANVGPLVALGRDLSRLEGGWRARWHHLWSPPEWDPPELGGPKAIPEPEAGRVTWDPQGGPGTNAYVLAHFATLIPSVMAVLAWSSGWGLAGRSAAIVAILWTTTTFGGLYERRAWVLPSELMRLLALATGAWFLHGQGAIPTAALLAGVLFATLSAVVLLRLARVSTSDADPGLALGPTTPPAPARVRR